MQGTRGLREAASATRGSILSETLGGAGSPLLQQITGTHANPSLEDFLKHNHWHSIQQFLRIGLTGALDYASNLRDYLSYVDYAAPSHVHIEEAVRKFLYVIDLRRESFHNSDNAAADAATSLSSPSLVAARDEQDVYGWSFTGWALVCAVVEGSANELTRVQGNDIVALLSYPMDSLMTCPYTFILSAYAMMNQPSPLPGGLATASESDNADVGAFARQSLCGRVFESGEHCLIVDRGTNTLAGDRRQVALSCRYCCSLLGLACVLHPVIEELEPQFVPVVLWTYPQLLPVAGRSFVQLCSLQPVFVVVETVSVDFVVVKCTHNRQAARREGLDAPTSDNTQKFDDEMQLEVGDLFLLRAEAGVLLEPRVAEPQEQSPWTPSQLAALRRRQGITLSVILFESAVGSMTLECAQSGTARESHCTVPVVVRLPGKLLTFNGKLHIRPGDLPSRLVSMSLPLALNITLAGEHLGGSFNLRTAPHQSQVWTLAEVPTHRSTTLLHFLAACNCTSLVSRLTANVDGADLHRLLSQRSASFDTPFAAAAATSDAHPLATFSIGRILSPLQSLSTVQSSAKLLLQLQHQREEELCFVPPEAFLYSWAPPSAPCCADMCSQPLALQFSAEAQRREFEVALHSYSVDFARVWLCRLIDGTDDQKLIELLVSELWSPGIRAGEDLKASLGRVLFCSDKGLPSPLLVAVHRRNRLAVRAMLQCVVPYLEYVAGGDVAGLSVFSALNQVLLLLLECTTWLIPLKLARTQEAAVTDILQTLLATVAAVRSWGVQWLRGAPSYPLFAFSAGDPYTPFLLTSSGKNTNIALYGVPVHALPSMDELVFYLECAHNQDAGVLHEYDMDYLVATLNAMQFFERTPEEHTRKDALMVRILDTPSFDLRRLLRVGAVTEYPMFERAGELILWMASDPALCTANYIGNVEVPHLAAPFAVNQALRYPFHWLLGRSLHRDIDERDFGDSGVRYWESMEYSFSDLVRSDFMRLPGVGFLSFQLRVCLERAEGEQPVTLSGDRVTIDGQTMMLSQFSAVHPGVFVPEPPPDARFFAYAYPPNTTVAAVRKKVALKSQKYSLPIHDLVSAGGFVFTDAGRGSVVQLRAFQAGMDLTFDGPFRLPQRLEPTTEDDPGWLVTPFTELEKFGVRRQTWLTSSELPQCEGAFAFEVFSDVPLVGARQVEGEAAAHSPLFYVHFVYFSLQTRQEAKLREVSQEPIHLAQILARTLNECAHSPQRYHAASDVYCRVPTVHEADIMFPIVSALDLELSTPLELALRLQCDAVLREMLSHPLCHYLWQRVTSSMGVLGRRAGANRPPIAVDANSLLVEAIRLVGVEENDYRQIPHHRVVQGARLVQYATEPIDPEGDLYDEWTVEEVEGCYWLRTNNTNFADRIALDNAPRFIDHVDEQQPPTDAVYYAYAYHTTPSSTGFFLYFDSNHKVVNAEYIMFETGVGTGHDHLSYFLLFGPMPFAHYDSDVIDPTALSWCDGAFPPHPATEHVKFTWLHVNTEIPETIPGGAFFVAQEDEDGNEMYFFYTCIPETRKWDPTHARSLPASLPMSPAPRRIAALRTILEACLRNDRSIAGASAITHSMDRFGLYSLPHSGADMTAVCLMLQYGLMSVLQDYLPRIEAAVSAQFSRHINNLIEESPHNRLSVRVQIDVACERGYESVWVDDGGLSLVHWAALSGSLPFLQCAVNVCGGPTISMCEHCMHRSSVLQRRPMHYAAYGGSPECVQMLLSVIESTQYRVGGDMSSVANEEEASLAISSSGVLTVPTVAADDDSTSLNGCTPLHTAVLYRHGRIALDLLKVGASPSKKVIVEPGEIPLDAHDLHLARRFVERNLAFVSTGEQARQTDESNMVLGEMLLDSDVTYKLYVASAVHMLRRSIVPAIFLCALLFYAELLLVGTMPSGAAHRAQLYYSIATIQTALSPQESLVSTKDVVAYFNQTFLETFFAVASHQVGVGSSYIVLGAALVGRFVREGGSCYGMQCRGSTSYHPSCGYYRWNESSTYIEATQSFNTFDFRDAEWAVIPQNRATNFNMEEFVVPGTAAVIGQMVLYSFSMGHIVVATALCETMAGGSAAFVPGFIPVQTSLYRASGRNIGRAVCEVVLVCILLHFVSSVFRKSIPFVKQLMPRGVVRWPVRQHHSTWRGRTVRVLVAIGKLATPWARDCLLEIVFVVFLSVLLAFHIELIVRMSKFPPLQSLDDVVAWTNTHVDTPFPNARSAALVALRIRNLTGFLVAFVILTILWSTTVIPVVGPCMISLLHVCFDVRVWFFFFSTVVNALALGYVLHNLYGASVSDYRNALAAFIKGLQYFWSERWQGPFKFENTVKQAPNFIMFFFSTIYAGILFRGVLEIVVWYTYEGEGVASAKAWYTLVQRVYVKAVLRLEYESVIRSHTDTATDEELLLLRGADVQRAPPTIRTEKRHHVSETLPADPQSAPRIGRSKRERVKDARSLME